MAESGRKQGQTLLQELCNKLLTKDDGNSIVTLDVPKYLGFWFMSYQMQENEWDKLFKAIIGSSVFKSLAFRPVAQFAHFAHLTPKKFVNYIASVLQNTKLQELIINCYLNDESLVTLAEALPISGLTVLNILPVELGTKEMYGSTGIKALANGIASSKTIKEVAITCTLKDFDVIKNLLKHETLDNLTLNIVGDKNGSFGKKLAGLLDGSRIHHITLSGDGANDETAITFAKLLPQLKNLRTLVLGDKVTNKGATALAKALQKNETLFDFGVGLDISDKAGKKLLHLFENSAYLRSLHVNSNQLSQELKDKFSTSNEQRCGRVQSEDPPSENGAGGIANSTKQPLMKFRVACLEREVTELREQVKYLLDLTQKQSYIIQQLCNKHNTDQTLSDLSPHSL